MKLRNILKLGVVLCLLIFALSVTGYAASVTSVTGTDGTNTFATTADAVAAYTPLESTLTVSGTVDTAEANVTIMISAESTTVYVNQTVADSNGAFKFEFPVSLEGGYTYEVKVNTENSDTASAMYFKTENNKYGDLNGDGKITGADTTLLSRHVAELKVSDAAKVSIAAGLADINGIGGITGADTTLLSRYVAELKVSDAATERLSWYVVD